MGTDGNRMRSDIVDMEDPVTSNFKHHPRMTE
jgi:hypothetical protein